MESCTSKMNGRDHIGMKTGNVEYIDEFEFMLLSIWVLHFDDDISSSFWLISVDSRVYHITTEWVILNKSRAIVCNVRVCYRVNNKGVDQRVWLSWVCCGKG